MPAIFVVLALGAVNLYAALTLSVGSSLVVLALSSVVLYSTDFLHPVASSFLLLIMLSLHLPPGEQSLVFSGFQSPLLYFLVAVTGVGMAVSQSGLGRVFVQWLQRSMAASRVPLPALLSLSFLPLSLILPSSVTRNAMLKPLMAEVVSAGRGRGEATRVGLTLGIVNALASSALLTGGLAPMVSASILGGFSWARWFVMMAFPYYSLMLVALGYIMLRYPVGKAAPDENLNQEAVPYVLRRGDWYILAVLVLMVGLWLTDRWHDLPTVVPAMIGFFLLMLGRHIEWKDIRQTGTWDTVIILGTLLSLVESLRRFGVLDLLTGRLAQLIPPGWPAPMLILTIVLATVAVNLLIPSITICLALLLPLFTHLAAELGLNPILVGLAITMTIDTVKFYPAQSMPLLMVADTGYFGKKDVLTMGFAMLAGLLIMLFAVYIPYWNLIGVGR